MRRTTLAFLTACTAALALPAAASAAEAVYGVTAEDRLIRFTSDGPGAVQSSVPIGGLADGENVVGIDVRPADDHLYAVTTGNRALIVNPITGNTRAAFGPFTTPLRGVGYGVDFNPVANALRIVSDADQNLRITAANATNNDGPLSYRAGDPGAGTDPSVTGAAYTNSVLGATTTALYDIDTARDSLVTQDPPNSGTLNTVGGLGADYDDVAGFDIAANGNVAYAALSRPNEDTHSLFRIDLATGRATPAATNARITVPSGAGALRGIATAGTVADDRTRPVLSVAFSSTILEQNTNPLRPSVSCDEACTVTVNARVQGRAAGEGAVALTGPGRATVRVPLNRTARARIARRGTELISLTIIAVDAAGNETRQTNRLSRTQTLAARRSG